MTEQGASSPYVRLACEDDCVFLSTRLREEDLNDLRVHGSEPLDALRLSFGSSLECYTACGTDDVPFAIFGVCDIYDGSLRLGAIWMLGSEDILKYVREFVPASKAWVDLFGEDHDLLFNFVHKDNKVHIRWLKKLGFSFIASRTINNETVFEFARINSNV